MGARYHKHMKSKKYKFWNIWTCVFVFLRSVSTTNGRATNTWSPRSTRFGWRSSWRRMTCWTRKTARRGAHALMKRRVSRLFCLFNYIYKVYISYWNWIHILKSSFPYDIFEALCWSYLKGSYDYRLGSWNLASRLKPVINK